MKRLYKSQSDKVLTGLLGGVAQYVGIDSTLVRVLFMIALVLSGFFPFGVMYIIAYFMVPMAPPHNTVSNQ